MKDFSSRNEGLSSHITFSHMVVDYCLRNRTFLEEWEPVREEEFYTSEFQLKQLRNDMECKESFRLWILKKGNEKKIIGSLRFTNIMPKNKRSLRVAEKAGFYKEGLSYR